MSRSLRFLMCKPEYFTVAYVINPWMNGNVNQTVIARAREQWQALFLEIAGRARIELVDPRPGFPDMPFSANAGFVFGEVAVPSRFRCEERRGEEPYFEEWFSSHGFSIVRMPGEVAFEGAGDALIDRGTLRIWAGWGHRSARESHAALQKQFGVDVVSLRLVDARYYHLDTCFCPLEGGYVLYYPPAFDEESNRTIERLVKPEMRIAIEDDDARDFACNAVNIDESILLNRASGRLRSRLESLGFEVIECELTEFLKAGGAAKCLTLRLDEPGIGSSTAQLDAAL